MANQLFVLGWRSPSDNATACRSRRTVTEAESLVNFTDASISIAEAEEMMDRVCCPNWCLNLIDSVLSKKDTYSDCTLKIGGVEYPCHKNVLGHLPYFQAKLDFEQSTNSKRRKLRNGQESEPVIVVDGITSRDATVVLLRHLYLDEIDHRKLENVAGELIEVASELLLDGLKDACGACLGRALTTDNVLSMYIMSDRMQLSNLKLAAQKFVKENFETIKNLADYESFLSTHGSLVTDLMSYMCSVIL